MVDGAPSSELPDNPSQHEDLPERLRVHSLARALGTTSRRVLDALTELDGRIRSAHSSVDRVDAMRVRDLLAAEPAADASAPAQASAAAQSGEPESRLMLETPTERPEYMPLFVAPQPIEAGEDSGSSDDDDTDDDGDDDDGEQADRPANRRRRRGRRGRGRGRGEPGGSGQD
ncbi:MAG: ribonuclease E/G, partial [Mycobacterium sp.]